MGEPGPQGPAGPPGSVVMAWPWMPLVPVGVMPTTPGSGGQIVIHIHQEEAPKVAEKVEGPVLVPPHIPVPVPVPAVAAIVPPVPRPLWTSVGS